MKVVTSAVTHVSSEDILHRGYSFKQLLETTMIDEGYYLFIYGVLPTRSEYVAFKKKLHQMRILPYEIKTVLKVLPRTTMGTDLLRTVISVMGSLEPESPENPATEVACRLLAMMSPSMAFWFNFHERKIEINTQTLDTDTTTENFLKLYFQTEVVDPLKLETLETYQYSYINSAMSASNFAVRVSASTVQDIQASIVTGMSSSTGEIHGGAIQAIFKMVKKMKSTEEME